MNLGIGVIQKRKGAVFGPPRTIARLAAFARRMASIHLPGELTVSQAELALAYGIRENITYSQHTRVEIAPSFSFRDHFSFPTTAREAAAVRQAPRSLDKAQATALFRTLFSRHERVVTFVNGASPIPVPLPVEKRPLAPDFPAPAAERIERVLVESRAPERRPAEISTAQTLRAEPGWGSPLSPPTSPKPFTLPPAEVKRVTDEVIREIDHRTIARRERMGRR
jgi:hypothetical protein